LSVSLVPFIFVAVLKIILSVYKALNTEIRDSYSVLRTIRIALLVISAAGLFYYDSLNSFLISLFLTGEFLDRIIFYIDFDQLSIKSLITRHITSIKNEKERG
jgi:hypothetical protein